jgi:hypothetical protein
VLGLKAQLADPEVHHVRALPVQRAADEACASDDQQPTIRWPVVHEGRPRLAALVRRHLDGRHDRFGDHPGETVRWAVLGFDLRDVVRPKGYRLAGRDHDDAVLRETVSAADLRGRRPADHAGTGALGDHCGVHRMVVVGVHR